MAAAGEKAKHKAEAKALTEAEEADKLAAEAGARALAEAEEKTGLEQATEVDIQAEALEEFGLEVEETLPSDFVDDFDQDVREGNICGSNFGEGIDEKLGGIPKRSLLTRNCLGVS